MINNINGILVKSFNDKALAEMRLTGNLLETNIVSTSDPVQINGGTAFTFPFTNKVTTSNTGTITYNGVSDSYFFVSISMTVEVVTGNTQTCNFFLAANGTVIPHAKAVAVLDQNQPQRITFTTTGLATPGDVYSIYAQNKTTTNNIIIDEVDFSGFSF